MKIRHRIPLDQLNKSAILTPEYQAEVDRTMAKAQVAFEQAQKRLEYEERRRARVQKQRPSHKRDKHLKELDALIELRRIDLEKYHRLMVSTGAPSTSRGVKSHRHVQTGGVL